MAGSKSKRLPAPRKRPGQFGGQGLDEQYRIGGLGSTPRWGWDAGTPAGGGGGGWTVAPGGGPGGYSGAYGAAPAGGGFDAAQGGAAAPSFMAPPGDPTGPAAPPVRTLAPPRGVAPAVSTLPSPSLPPLPPPTPVIAQRGPAVTNVGGVNVPTGLANILGAAAASQVPTPAGMYRSAGGGFVPTTGTAPGLKPRALAPPAPPSTNRSVRQY